MPPLICICEDILQEQQQQDGTIAKFVSLMSKVAV